MESELILIQFITSGIPVPASSSPSQTMVSVFLYLLLPIFPLLCTWRPAQAYVQGIWVEEYEEPFSELMPGGQEGSDPYPTFICRGKPNGHYVPGKLLPSTAKCFMASGQGETATLFFQVLLKKSNYEWVKGKGVIPSNALEGGRTDIGDKLFICRTDALELEKKRWRGKAMLVGIAGVDGEFCSAPWDGRTVKHTDFEILVANEEAEEEEEDDEERSNLGIRRNLTRRSLK